MADNWALVWLQVRVRLLGTAGAVGILVGGLGIAFLTISTALSVASAQVFSLGALVCGFGVLGWSGSALVGRSIEGMQRRLDIATGWSERDSRRAMARLTGFGAGVMIGVAIVTTLLA